jgi:hypothetical protein
MCPPLDSPDGKTHSQTQHVLIDEKGTIKVYLMSNILEELNVILTITWWLQKLDKHCH